MKTVVSTRWLLRIGAVFLLTTAQTCQGPVRPASGPAAPVTPVATLPQLLADAGQCGRSLGIAVRCNMIRNESDFAVLRYAALNGMRARAGASFDQVAATMDGATLDMINSVGVCRTSAVDRQILENHIESTLSRCSGTP